MEKKIYIAPEVTVTNVETTPILAGSLNPGKSNGTLEISSGESTDGWADAKHYDVWADDEE